jgi:hypothetical protein
MQKLDAHPDWANAPALLRLANGFQSLPSLHSRTGLTPRWFGRGQILSQFLCGFFAPLFSGGRSLACLYTF